MKSRILQELDEHQEVIDKTILQCQEEIYFAADLVVNAMKRGGKLLLAGNGGSAADAQHIAAELTGRYLKERRALPAIALSTDTSALTAIGNDYGFLKVFERQVEAIGQRGDVLLAISTSGNSKNLISALEKAKEVGIKRVGFLGKDGGAMKELCELSVVIPSDCTPRIQEMHILMGHILCKMIEEELCAA